jgi:probable F420-dependent oxidoreductase
MSSFLDALDAAGADACREERLLAALGPRMLDLARERTAGAHPFLVTPEHTAIARAALGPGKLLAPEIKAVLVEDPGQARAIARTQTSICVAQPNYINNLLRMGFEEHDLLDGGSDRLVDAVVAWGDESVVADRVTAHLDAGADHVAVQVLTSEPGKAPREEWRRIAAAVAELG